MEPVSSRHEGDLGGLLDAFDPARAVSVGVVLTPTAAATISGQHTAWMLVNLLARAEGIVSHVAVSGSSAILASNHIVPFGTATDLRERLVEGGTAIGVVPVILREGAHDYVIQVGIADDVSPDAHVSQVIGTAWWGGFAPAGAPIPEAWRGLDLARAESLGPYAAAALAAADVFLRVRAPGLRRDVKAAHGWNGWTRQPETSPTDIGPTLHGLELIDVGLAGVGAVGAAWMHTLWAMPAVRGRIVIADADDEGVSASNLNRGLLFTRTDLERPKASVAASVATGSIAWTPHDGRFEEQPARPRMLVSAVDSNAARATLQALYPADVLSGSTRDIRAEAMTVGAPGIGACLRCYNPPEPVVSDLDVRARARTEGVIAMVNVARAIGSDIESVQSRLDSGACDAISDRMISYLRARYGADAAPARFAVGFTSLMAGVLLAGETIRSRMRLTALSGASERTNFQFRDPAASVNKSGPYLSDGSCPVCANADAIRVWRARRGAGT